MDVRPQEAPDQLSGATETTTQQTNGRGLQPGQIARILGEHQQHELLIARGFTECRGLSYHQLEDLYQETTLALLHRPYRDEKHLRDALRRGIKHRALNLYRDEHRHEEILAGSVPDLDALEYARSAEEDPQRILLARQDRLIITEFLAELTVEERRVFWLSTEDMGYNLIAKTLNIPVNQARNAVASCERKRERFQLLHDSGRLCGYRASTIKSLLQGQATSEHLAQLALAHLQSCAHCRVEHHTNAKQLRHAFQQQAAALLPPVLLEQLGRLSRASMHARILAHRLQSSGGLSFSPGTSGGGGIRENTIALLAGSSASAKLAIAGMMTVAAIAGGTLTATHTLEHHPHPRSHAATHASTTARTTEPVDFTTPAPAPFMSPPSERSPHTAATAHPNSPGHVVAIAHSASSHSTSIRREPGGFAYLGVPTNTPAPTPAPPPVPAQPTRTAAHTGGPFSP